jgi:hypothetical protein
MQPAARSAMQKKNRRRTVVESIKTLHFDLDMSDPDSAPDSAPARPDLRPAAVPLEVAPPAAPLERPKLVRQQAVFLPNSRGTNAK